VTDGCCYETIVIRPQTPGSPHTHNTNNTHNSFPFARTMSESRKLEKSRRAQKRVARRRAKGDGEPSDEQNDK